MCGIAGILSTGQASPDSLAAMLDQIAHRGPDHRGVYLSDWVALGMNRLAIIDLAGGDQPMHSPDGRYTIVYNGEIYNFRELREQLQGHIEFGTRSDTEVILNGYALWGEEIFARLNGIFAVAIHDRLAGKVILARDSVGVKPLYYFRDSEKLVFSSELKSFSLTGLANTIRRGALSQFLCAGYVFHPETAFDGVAQLAPGELMEVGQGGVVLRRRQFRIPGRPTRSDADRLVPTPEAFRQRLGQAILGQTVADVPFGLLLSAGLDSMAILAELKRCGLTDNLDTYTIAFDEQSFCEGDAVTRVAQAFGVRNQQLRLMPNDVGERVEDICRTFDNLELLPTCVAIYFASHMAAGKLKVLLAGNGGDEIFFGYPTYTATGLVRRMGAPVASVVKRLSPLARLLPSSSKYLSVSERVRRFVDGLASDPDVAHVSWRHIFTHGETLDLLASGYAENDIRAVYGHQIEHFVQARQLGFDADDTYSWGDLRSWLTDCGLSMWDKAGMSASVEIRVPLVDNDFLDDAYSVPASVRSGGKPGSKKFLRDVLKPDLPQEILSMPKHGFQVPVARWLRGDLAGQFRDYTEDLPTEVFNKPAIRVLWKEFNAGRLDHALKLWSLGMLACWARVHRVRWN